MSAQVDMGAVEKRFRSLTLVTGNHEALNTPVPDFDFDNPPEDPEFIAHVLSYAVKQRAGFGLAANQLGLPYRALAFGSNRDGYRVIFNPKITFASDDCNLADEACLSFPRLVLHVSRANQIRLRYQDYTGYLDTSVFTGFTSRILQHEVDHLNGVSFTKKVNRIHLDRAARKARRMASFNKKSAKSLGSNKANPWTNEWCS